MRKLRDLAGSAKTAMAVAVWLAVLLIGAPAGARQMPGADQLALADDFAARAIKRAGEARKNCDAELIKEALELAEEAVFVTSSVAAEAKKSNNLDLADSAYNRTQIIGDALWGITDACRTCCREKNEEKGEKTYCCDCDLVKATLRLARNIATLSRDAAVHAKETDYKKLGGTAYSCANAIAGALANLTGACACCSPGGDGEGAGCCCDCDLPLETVRLGKEIGFVVLAETEAALESKDKNLAKEAYGAAHALGEALWRMSESWMSWIFCNQSRWGASSWLCFCDCGLMDDTTTLGQTLELLVSRAADLAAQEKDPELVQDAYDMADTFDKGVRGFGSIATHCIRTSMDLAYVTCSRAGFAAAERMTERNEKIMEDLIKLGATPEKPVVAEGPEPPIRDEIPIRDHEQPPFSPVE